MSNKIKGIRNMLRKITLLWDEGYGKEKLNGWGIFRRNFRENTGKRDNQITRGIKLHRYRPKIYETKVMQFPSLF